jgi:hypothetical protein
MGVSGQRHAPADVGAICWPKSLTVKDGKALFVSELGTESGITYRYNKLYIKICL